LYNPPRNHHMLAEYRLPGPLDMSAPYGLKAHSSLEDSSRLLR
jgi:hypothetical protein